jgi:hypothetical protein
MSRRGRQLLVAALVALLGAGVLRLQFRRRPLGHALLTGAPWEKMAADLPTVIRRLSASPSKVSDVKSPPPAKATPAHVPSPSGSREQREQRADLERFVKLRDAARAAGMSVAEYRAQQAQQTA